MEIQPEIQNPTDDFSLKSSETVLTKANKDHYRPFKANFELHSEFQGIVPAPPDPFFTHLHIYGNGNATHLGKTEFFMDQYWQRIAWGSPFSKGYGTIILYAANGDELYATFTGDADHSNDPNVPVINIGTFNGGTGKFTNATGEFEWIGDFLLDMTIPKPPPINTITGTGTVVVKGEIMY